MHSSPHSKEKKKTNTKTITTTKISIKKKPSGVQKNTEIVFSTLKLYIQHLKEQRHSIHFMEKPSQLTTEPVTAPQSLFQPPLIFISTITL